MKTATTVRARAAVLSLAIAGSSLAGCAGKAAPKTAVTPVKPPAAAPAPAPAPPAAPAPAAVPRPPAPPPLVGHVSRAAIEDHEGWKTLRAQDYTPDASAVRTIAERGRDVQVLLILGTWCPDSKREVPRFFKILDQAGIRLDKVTMVGVDRTKKDAEGLTVKHEILRVPTFVFFRGSTEIGRVTERATTTLENDIATILMK
jgi:hypothetical protein